MPSGVPSIFCVEDWLIAGMNASGVLLYPFFRPIEIVTRGVADFIAPNTTKLILDFLADSRSGHAKHLPLMNLFHVILIGAAYLAIVFSGMKYMETREKMNPKKFTLIHNLIMSSLSLYMCVGTIWQTYHDGYGFLMNPPDETKTGWPMAKMVWLFSMSKIPEFIDTFLMVVKKNFRQISFLHLYHHTSIFLICWLFCFVAPGGEAYLSVILNSGVHVIMYGYYFLSAMGVGWVSFVKKYITMMQITQFCIMMVQHTLDIVINIFTTPKESYPVSISILMWFYISSMLALFANFYIQDRKREAALKKDGKAGDAKKKN
ncbi:polyunsaturated fatty acid elongation enzyme [Gonapodya prolifera JEL478]|uniref:Elongation of fatty acids protein n=1 Tax=Gonapodya prolifera (strain JEL478) TaxID=1344416 RepID=A0A139ARE2_GONPJ|nr:polyunsaturated fatty acid elongation enzyme [Gonapodya prolifera JEL478]|eukprot:KXS19299.1 polyunsaturated fatty acid elongation enzyme [Gonapodya prolifera JEL478]